MSLPLLPQELLLGIAGQFEYARNINSLAQTHTRLYLILNPYLYRWDVRHHRNRALVWAIEYGQAATVQKALEAGTDPQAARWCVTSQMLPGTGMKIQDRMLITPLMQAANYGWEPVVELLLATKSVVPDAKTSSKQSPLSLAASEGHVGVVKLLLATERVDVNAMSVDGKTALSRAVGNGHEAVVRVLLATGRITWCIRSRSLLCVMPHNESMAELLLDTEDIDPDVEDADGWTPLMQAAFIGNEKLVKLLLAAGADPNSISNTRQTPLSCAHREEVVSLLLAAQANPNFRDYEGRTKLSQAAELGNHEVVKQLLATKGVDPDSKNSDGRTPLSWATQCWEHEIVKLLLATNDVDPNSKDFRGRTPLSWAAQYGEHEIVKQLLAIKDVDPDSKDSYGRSPLSWAAGAGSGNYITARLLLAAA